MAVVFFFFLNGHVEDTLPSFKMWPGRDEQFYLMNEVYIFTLFRFRRGWRRTHNTLFIGAANRTTYANAIANAISPPQKCCKIWKKEFIGLSNRVTGRRRTEVERERGANPRAAELLNAEERRLDLEWHSSYCSWHLCIVRAHMCSKSRT